MAGDAERSAFLPVHGVAHLAIPTDSTRCRAHGPAGQEKERSSRTSDGATDLPTWLGRAHPSSQLHGGLWHKYELLSWPKYTATHWQYLVLADLGVTIRDRRMRKTTDLLIDHSSAKDGGFGSGGMAYFCITGNLARAFVQVGMGSDDRVRMAI